MKFQRFSGQGFRMQGKRAILCINQGEYTCANFVVGIYIESLVVYYKLKIALLNAIKYVKICISTPNLIQLLKNDATD